MRIIAALLAVLLSSLARPKLAGADGRSAADVPLGG